MLRMLLRNAALLCKPKPGASDLTELREKARICHCVLIVHAETDRLSLVTCRAP